MSGLLNQAGGDKTDLGTLEKQLANRSENGTGATPEHSSKSDTQSRTQGSQHSTPRLENMPTPKSAMSSPEPPKEKEAAVEELSDMMCSLVTNNCGETRYIGMECALRGSCIVELMLLRLLVRVLHILSERHTVGQRKDWG